MLHLDIGLSVLRAQQQAMSTVSQNIANASNENYVRQRVEFAPRGDVNVNGQWQGTGVDISQIQRLVDKGVGAALLEATSQTASATVQLDYARQIESIVQPGSGALSDALNTFFNAARELTSQPNEVGLRQQFVAAASDLAETMNGVLQSLDALQSDLNQRATDTATQTNDLMQQLSSVQKQIIASDQSNGASNSLLDQRDQLLAKLAQLVDIDPLTLLREGTSIVAGGGGLLIGSSVSNLAVAVGSNGRFSFQSSTATVVPRGGQLNGLLVAQSQLASVRQKLREWSTQLVRSVDQIQATGLGQAGSASVITGTRTIADANVPLTSTGTALPIAAGKLTLSVTDQQSGATSLSSIRIDPATDSLQDVLTRISSIPHVAARFDSQTGRTQIVADPGYAIDFAHHFPTQPNLTSYTGTSVPAISGSYTGGTDRQLIGEILQGGTVGLDGNVTVQIRDATTGDEVALLQLGNGTAAGHPQEVLDGVALTFGLGQLNAGDTFAFDLTSNTDTTGILSAIGLGTLFTGSPDGTLSVNSQIQLNPQLLATGQSTSPNDGSGYARMSTLITGQSNDLADIISASGIDVARLQARSEATQWQQETLRTQRNSVSGVDPNEEMLQLLEFQRSFQAASRLVVSINQTLDDLFTLIR